MTDAEGPVADYICDRAQPTRHAILIDPADQSPEVAAKRAIAAATAAIGDQQWLRENREKVLATRERMSGRLEQIGFDVVPSQANFVWCTHKEEALKSVYEHLKSNHVLVRYIDYPDWGDGLRISVGTDAQVDACLDLLEARVRS